VLKIGNMAKQQFCSSHGALNFAGCIGRSGRAVDPRQSEERARIVPADYASDWHTASRGEDVRKTVR